MSNRNNGLRPKEGCDTRNEWYVVQYELKIERLSKENILKIILTFSSNFGKKLRKCCSPVAQLVERVAVGKGTNG